MRNIAIGDNIHTEVKVHCANKQISMRKWIESVLVEALNGYVDEKEEE